MKLRFAPSPTGFLHVGNARIAITNALLALRHNGELILRLDDTDTERSRPEFAQAIEEDLAWLGIALAGTGTAAGSHRGCMMPPQRGSRPAATSTPASNPRKSCASSASSGPNRASRRSMTAPC